jgi:hypothetical protein
MRDSVVRLLALTAPLLDMPPLKPKCGVVVALSSDFVPTRLRRAWWQILVWLRLRQSVIEIAEEELARFLAFKVRSKFEAGGYFAKAGEPAGMLTATYDAERNLFRFVSH